MMNVIDENNELNSELNIVYRYLRKIGIAQADAEDAVQETAYKYLLYYDTIQTSKIRSWLIRVSLNFYYDQCRKQQRYEITIPKTVEADMNQLPEVIFLEKERNIELGYAISKLKPHFQELLLLKYHSGLSYEDIYKILEVKVSSIKTNLFRARKQLAKVYKEANYE